MLTILAQSAPDWSTMAGTGGIVAVLALVMRWLMEQVLKRLDEVRTETNRELRLQGERIETLARAQLTLILSISENQSARESAQRELDRLNRTSPQTPS